MRRLGLVFPLITSGLLIAGCSPPSGREQSGEPRGSVLGRSIVPVEDPSTPTPPASIPPRGPLSPTDLAGEWDATALAQRMLAGGEEVLPALRAALVISGLPVLDDDGQLVVIDGHTGSGVPLPAWEARILAANAASAGGMRLAELGYVLKGLPGLSEAPVAEMILDGIREAADGTDPELRFWAQFLTELGQSAEPAVLLSAASPDEVMLNGLQVQLILRRLANDLALEGRSDRADVGIFSWLIPAAAAAEFPHVQSPGPGSCASAGSEKLVKDTAGWGIKTGFKKLIKKIAEEGSRGATVYLLGLKFAQPVLDYAKLLVTFWALEIDVALDRDPLLRTKSRRPASGEQRRLTATVHYNYSYFKQDAELVNCMWLALAMAGVKFDPPSPGPAAGAGINWVGLNGFQIYSQGKVMNPIVRFFGSNPANQVTDGNGRVSIGVEGLGQERDIPRKAEGVTKKATVRVLVQVKRGDLGKDLFDLKGGLEQPGAQFLNRPFDLTFLSKLPAELLYRTRWLKPTDYSFSVVDWAEHRDYRVNGFTHVAGRSVDRFEGVKCDGALGTWRLHRRHDEPDASWGGDGDVLVTIDEDHRGGLTFTSHESGPGGSCYFEERGRAEFIASADDSLPLLRLEFQGGPFQCNTGAGHKSGVYVITIPVEPGRFCD